MVAQDLAQHLDSPLGIIRSALSAELSALLDKEIKTRILHYHADGITRNRLVGQHFAANALALSRGLQE
jgi:hypothetical protein